MTSLLPSQSSLTVTEGPCAEASGESGEPGLKTLQTDLLEESPVVNHGTAPLLVVVGAIDLGLDTPPATFESIISDVCLNHPAELTDSRFIKR